MAWGKGDVICGRGREEEKMIHMYNLVYCFPFISLKCFYVCVIQWHTSLSHLSHSMSPKRVIVSKVVMIISSKQQMGKIYIRTIVFPDITF